MCRCTTTQLPLTSTSLLANICLPMEVTHIAGSCLFRIEVYGTILQNGVEQPFGRYIRLYLGLQDNDTSCSPQKKEELFNLRHASARNVVERILGILKRRFRILLLAPELSLKVQSKIPAALCVLHNFTRAHDPSDDNDDEEDFTDEEDSGDNNNQATENAAEVNMNEEAREMRDHIANTMWNDYLNLRRQQQLLRFDGSDNEDSDGSNDDD